MQLQIVELGRDALAAPGQEAGPHPVSDVAEAQIKAGRLQLVGQQRFGELHHLFDNKLTDRLRGQDALDGRLGRGLRSFDLGLSHRR